MADVPPVGTPPWVPATQVGVIAAVVVSLAAVRWLERGRGWGRRRRSRLLLGVPWGTVVVILFVLSVYLFVQGGIDHPRHPVTVPFRSWSYLYPLGMAVAPFAHAGVNHLTGNLVATAVLGSLAEYAWGHFPEERGSTSFSSAATNPYFRAFVAFPAGTVAIGLLTSLFGWGPIIGFSGAVFAFAGFALVRYPLATVIALTVEDAVRVVYLALRDPVLAAEAKPQFVTPWWAGVAVQGHLLGLFLGIVVGAVALRRRDPPSAPRLWAGAVLVATSFSLWAVWWFRGNAKFVLFRGLGVILVLALALLVVLGVRAARSDRTVRDVPLAAAGVLALVFPVLVIGAVAVPLNLNAVGATGLPADAETVEVRDYTVAYAENVTNQQTSIVNVSALGETTRVRASGVIVVSEERQVWTTAVPTSRLKFAGEASVRVGGLGWQRTVAVERRGWSVAHNATAYRIRLKPPGENWTVTFRSEPAIAEPELEGTRVAVRPTGEGFVLELRRDGATVETRPMPTANRTVFAAGVAFVREGKKVFAEFDGTRVRVAKEEAYREDQSIR